MTASGPVSPAAQIKLAKAEKFMAVADVALSSEYYDAAVSLAVSAGINYADALCIHRLGRHPSGQSHDDILTLLRRCGPVGEAVALHQRRLLKNKVKAQYSATECSAREAASAYSQAERLGALVRTELTREVKR